MKTTAKHNELKEKITLQTGNKDVQLTLEEALELKYELTEALFKLSHQENKKEDNECKKVSLEDLEQSIEEYTLEWKDVIGFDFCVTRMENSYSSIESEGRLLLKEDMKYETINGHEYERDFHWVEMDNIEENFLEEQVWDKNELSLDEIKTCLSDDLIQYVIEHPDFQLKWDSYPITANDLIEDGEKKFFEFGSNYDS